MLFRVSLKPVDSARDAQNPAIDSRQIGIRFRQPHHVCIAEPISRPASPIA